jgi:hypothetical protein
MDDFEQRPDESLAAYAMRRRSLGTDHPAYLSSEQCADFINLEIDAVERRQRVVIEALGRAGLSGARF